MAKKAKAAEPPIRKSFIIGGGVVIGIALLAFIVNTFVLGGGGDFDTGPVLGTPGSAPSSTSAPAAGVPGSDDVPATGTDTSNVTKNDLTPGGRNPFSKQAKGASAPTSTTVAAAAVKAPTPHTWQMLELKDGEATILVDGKKKIVSVGDTLIGDYKFNSITGKCVTVKGASTFGLCPGAAPFTQ